MQQEGYNQEQISNYINALNQTEQEPIEGAEMQETPAQPEPQPINNPEYEQALNYQQERINQLEAQQKKENTQSLKADLNIAVDNSFKNNNDMKILLQKLNSINGSEGNDARLDLMKQEIMTETMNNLRNRKNAGGIFDKSWFAEETNRATDSVVAKFRTVIGDPNRIQRAPETASELHSFINSKPVEPPKYESGDRVMGKGDTKAKQYTNDALSRLAAEINLGGETRA